MCQHHAPLIRIDGMRGTAHSDHGYRLYGVRCRDGEGAAIWHGDWSRGADDRGAVCGRVVAVEEVGRGEDLCVPVVCGAGGAAEAAAAGHDCAVGQ